MASAPTKQIGDRIYAFGLLPPSKALRLQVDLVRPLGEPLARLFAVIDIHKIAGMKGTADAQQITREIIAEADTVLPMVIATLTSKLNADEILAMWANALSVVSYGDGKSDAKPITDIDVAFAGRSPLEPWNVFWEVVKGTLGPFIPAALLDLLRPVPAAAA